MVKSKVRRAFCLDHRKSKSRSLSTAGRLIEANWRVGEPLTNVLIALLGTGKEQAHTISREYLNKISSSREDWLVHTDLVTKLVTWVLSTDRSDLREFLNGLLAETIPDRDWDVVIGFALYNSNVSEPVVAFAKQWLHFRRFGRRPDLPICQLLDLMPDDQELVEVARSIRATGEVHKGAVENIKKKLRELGYGE